MREVLSIPPMSGTYLTPQSVLTVRAQTGNIRTAIYVAVTVGGPSHSKPIIRDGECSINCAVTTHSMGCREGKRING